jgi:hypothetical protein
LQEWKSEGGYTNFHIGPNRTVYLRAIGQELNSKFVDHLRSVLGKAGIRLDAMSQKESYYLLSDDYPLRSAPFQGPRPDSDLAQELRPGSGIVRISGGVPMGPAGTLTCFLASEDSSDIFLLAAGHVVSDFWKEHPAPNPKSSIYHNPKGFPSTNSTKAIGKMIARSNPPLNISNRVEDAMAEETCRLDPCCSDTDIDVGIVSVVGEFEWKQRTTCYGTFGEWPGDPKRPTMYTRVMKCGSEESHWTFACVTDVSATVSVYGPNGALYDFRGQVILSQEDYPPSSKSDKVNDVYYPIPSFAVPGDSGTMVVDYETQKPLGMLIAGSILDGKYVMTPLKELECYWKKLGYVFLRA